MFREQLVRNYVTYRHALSQGHLLVVGSRNLGSSFTGLFLSIVFSKHSSSEKDFVDSFITSEHWSRIVTK